MSDYDKRISHRAPNLIDGVPHRGKRHNAGKPRPSLIPPTWMQELMKVMEKGAEKYDEHNWKLGMPYSEVIDSLERHLLDFKSGMDIDPDDQLSTIVKVAVNALFLRYYQIKGVGDDNRKTLG